MGTTYHRTRLVPRVLDGPATARADGALPPTPRWLKDDPYAPARWAIGMPWIDRHMLEARRQRAVDALDALDRESVDWMRRKQAADREALAVHDLLWPAIPDGWARRPPRPDQAPLPPVATDARPLFGRHLRRVCLSLLHQHGELALRDLHLLLILHGFTLTGSAPVKALADALGHEHDHGRVVRVRRGVYAPTNPDGPQPRADPELGTAPEDWYPALVASSVAEPAHGGEGTLGQLLGGLPERPRSRSSSAMAPWR